MELYKIFQQYIIPASVGSGVALLVLRFLSRKIINQILSKEMEKYKSQLQEKATYLKTSLSIYAEEQNVANQRIDSQKSKAIHEVYSAICAASHPVSRIIAGSHFVSAQHDDHVQFYKERGEEAHSAFMHLSDLLVSYAIYFDEPTYKQISDLSIKYSYDVALFLRVIRKNEAKSTDSNELLNYIENEREKLDKLYHEQLKHMHYDLTKKFRSLLGIEKCYSVNNEGRNDIS